MVSGNVSFYNETNGEAIHPTPVMGMVGLIGPSPTAATPGFPADGLNVLLLGETGEDMGGSEYLFCVHGLDRGRGARLDLDLEKRVQSTCTEGIRRDLIDSAHDCSRRGSGRGLAGVLPGGEDGAPPSRWNAPTRCPWCGSSASPSRASWSRVPDDKLEMMEVLARRRNIPYTIIGKTGGERLVVNDWLDVDLEVTRERWEQALQEILS